MAQPTPVPDRRRATPASPSATGASAPPAGGSGRARAQIDDTTRITVLLVVFTVAMLLVVVALLGTAYIDTWWALAALMIVHFAMTVLDFAGVVYVFTGEFPLLGGRRAAG